MRQSGRASRSRGRWSARASSTVPTGRRRTAPLRAEGANSPVYRTLGGRSLTLSRRCTEDRSAPAQHMRTLPLGSSTVLPEPAEPQLERHCVDAPSPFTSRPTLMRAPAAQDTIGNCLHGCSPGGARWPHRTAGICVQQCGHKDGMASRPPDLRAAGDLSPRPASGPRPQADDQKIDSVQEYVH